MYIRVEAYSGYRANERPIRFWIKERPFEVVEILDNWYGPDYQYWKLKADDGAIYIIKYDMVNDEWTIEWMNARPK